MSDEPVGTRWHRLTGGVSGQEYAERMAAHAAQSADAHGEATLVHGLVGPGARILDAGCGTGRVALRLAELGHDCVGVDADRSMLEVARRSGPGISWLEADLAALPEAVTCVPPFDLVLMAGNVVPLLAEGTLESTLAALGGVLRPEGLLVAGFGLDDGHLPEGCPPTPWSDYVNAARAAGLVLEAAYATWDADPLDAQQGYAVGVHRR